MTKLSKSLILYSVHYKLINSPLNAQMQKAVQVEL